MRNRPAVDRLPPALVISLDFELLWGTSGPVDVEASRRKMLGARDAVAYMLDLFQRHDIHATWATVGFLFFDNKEELLSCMPKEIPQYGDPRLSSYARLASIGETEKDDPCHYARSLVKRIHDCPGQEMATHTFSHYYCLEPGQDVNTFQQDLAAAKRAADLLGIELQSLVFPRNQYNAAYLATCRDQGIIAFRGNEQSWIYQAANTAGASLKRRAVRLADSYIDISGQHIHHPQRSQSGLVDVPASRFLRPASNNLRWLDPQRMTRIKHSMRCAAQGGGIFHIWWHPHNFAVDLKANASRLEDIVIYFKELRDSYGMQSLSMLEAAERVP